MAKQIEPVNIWINGESKIGKYFSVACEFDDYESQASNRWQIYDTIINENSTDQIYSVLASGSLIISGEDYVNWGNLPAMSINEWIYQWSAEKLNLTIIQ